MNYFKRWIELHGIEEMFANDITWSFGHEMGGGDF